MFKSDNPTAAQVEFKERLEELIDNKPDGISVLCFINTKISENEARAACIFTGSLPELGHSIYTLICEDSRVESILKACLNLKYEKNNPTTVTSKTSENEKENTND